MRCGACGKFTSAVGGARCSVCPGLYHKACIGIPEAAQIVPGWVCPECKTKMPKGGNTTTPVKHASSDYQLDTSAASGGSSQSLAEDCTGAVCDNTVFDTTQPLDLCMEMRLFREELREVRKEVREFRTELFDMRSVITGCNRRIDEIEGRLGAIEKGALVTGQDGLGRGELRVLEQAVAKLQEELNDRDQELLQADIEISNLPEVKGENPIHTVTVLATKLGVDLENKDIIFAERVGRASESADQSGGASRDRRLVVRLARRGLRDELLRSARLRRGATTQDMGLDAPPKRFYVNERLTRRNRNLFYLAREAARRAQWKYTWTKRGRIYARKADGQPAHSIKVEADVDRVFGVTQCL